MHHAARPWSMYQRHGPRTPGLSLRWWCVNRFMDHAGTSWSMYQRQGPWTPGLSLSLVRVSTLHLKYVFPRDVLHRSHVCITYTMRCCLNILESSDDAPCQLMPMQS